MAVISFISYSWWGMSLITILFIVIALACLIPALYAWQASRRIDKQLDKDLKARQNEYRDEKTGKV